MEWYDQWRAEYLIAYDEDGKMVYYERWFQDLEEARDMKADLERGDSNSIYRLVKIQLLRD